ncbi:Crp/Fnr family transcriptional regulator [Corynebacterium sp. NPDC060344]|uniref:Crp/Fnr family transcriptional regulator n=1 Tax=Corynebacterium sp. NPDC060344 TaxID=3347101 RepID=UPI003650EB87
MARSDSGAAAPRTTPLRHGCGHPHHCPEPVRLRVLARTPLFRGLGDDVIADVDSRMAAHAWAGGEHLYVEGDPAEELFVLASGRAKVLRTSPDGVETILDVLGPGDLFGGLTTLGVTRHGESVRALQTTCALRIGAVEFRALLADHPEVAVRAFDEVAAQLHEVRGLFSATTTGTVAQRVAHVLLRLAAKFGETRPQGLVIQVPLSRADIAAMAGSTTESVSRAMSAMRRDGLIDSGRKWTSLLDTAGLRELSGECAVD